MFNLLAQPKLNDVFKSIQSNTQGTETDSSRIVAFMLLIIAIALAYTAVKHWNKRSTKPRVVHSHRKLLRETCRRAGVDRAKVKQISDLADAQGLASPLVAMICPSVLRKLAANAKSDAQRRALADAAREIVD
jgi:cell division inhibitor SulA